MDLYVFRIYLPLQRLTKNKSKNMLQKTSDLFLGEFGNFYFESATTCAQAMCKRRLHLVYANYYVRNYQNNWKQRKMTWEIWNSKNPETRGILFFLGKNVLTFVKVLVSSWYNTYNMKIKHISTKITLLKLRNFFDNLCYQKLTIWEDCFLSYICIVCLQQYRQ